MEFGEISFGRTETEKSTTERNRLLRRLEIADKSERVIGNNLLALETISDDVIPLTPDQARGQRPIISLPSERLGFVNTRNHGVAITFPVYDNEGREVKRITYGRKLTNLAQRAFVRIAPFFLTIPPIRRSIVSGLAELEASKEAKRMDRFANEQPYSIDPSVDPDVVSAIYQTERIKKKCAWREFILSADEETLAALTNSITRPEKAIRENYLRMIGPLNARRFTFSSPPIPTLIHFSRKPIPGSEITASKTLSKRSYPEGIEAHVIKTITEGDKEEAQKLLSYYFFGNSKSGSIGNYGDYPIEEQTKATDVVLGQDNVVFLTAFTTGGIYSREHNEVPYAFSADSVAEIPGAFTNAADVSIIESVLGSTHLGNQETLAEATKLHAASIISVKQYLDFYERYVEYVFDSEKSYLKYIQSRKRNIHDKTKDGTSSSSRLESVYRLDLLTEEERGRALNLWVEHQIIPPFLTEFCIPRGIAIPDGSVGKAEQILSRETTISYDKTGRQIVSNLAERDGEITIDSKNTQHPIDIQIARMAYGRPIQESIELLSDSCPLIKTLFNQPVVEDDGSIITVAEHTRKVADILAEVEDEIDIPLGLKIEDLRILFTLHDLGKSAEMMTGPKSARNHQQTREIAEILISEIPEIDEQTKQTIVRVLSQDVLGRYLRGYVSLESATDQISEMSTGVNGDKSELFELLKLYYFCDASSYSGLENYVRSPQGGYRFSEDYKEMIDELGQRVEESQKK